MLDDDEVFLARFDAMLPGKDATPFTRSPGENRGDRDQADRQVDGRLGLATVLWGWALFACGQASQPIALGHDRTDAYVDVCAAKRWPSWATTPRSLTPLREPCIWWIPCFDSASTWRTSLPLNTAAWGSRQRCPHQDGIDGPTGLPVYSFTAHKKPTAIGRRCLGL